MAVFEPRAPDDQDRLAALRRTGLLDSPPEEDFDRLTRLATRVLHAPVALVSLVDADRQFFKSCVGLPSPWFEARQTPLSHSFCQQAVARGEPFIVQDARSDPRVAGNGAVQDLDVIAYAGVPLLLSDGHVLGSFCVIDHHARSWTQEEIETLQDLAASVMTEIELRQEVQERRRMEQALSGSEAELRRMLDSLIAFVGIMSPEGILLEANRPALEAADLRFEDVLGKPFEETYWWSYDPGVQRQLRQAINRAAAGEVVRYDVDVRVGEERFMAIDFMLAPMHGDQGQVVRLVPSAIDITDRKRTETERARLLEAAQQAQLEAEAARRALEQERNRLQQVLDVMPEGVLIADANREYALCNAAAAEILGVDLTNSRLLGTPIGEFQPRRPDGAPLSRENIPLARSLLQGETVRGERLLVRRHDSGEDVSVLVSSAPLHGAEGCPSGAVAVFQDISAIAQLEQQKDDFVATVSHDLRSPITAIRGHTQILQRLLPRLDDPLVPRLADGLGRIEAATRHMVQMLDDLVDLAYLAMHRDVALRREPTDLAALARDAVADVQEQRESLQVRLEGADELVGRVDGPRLRRVLDNLLSNAVKYSPNGGVVTVRLSAVQRQGSTWARLQVEDQGVGIPAEDLPRIFDPYRRGQNVAGMKGTGLGLAGVQQIVLQHGGRIDISSQLDQGTMVTLELPLTPTEE